MWLSHRHAGVLISSFLVCLSKADYISPLHFAALQQRQGCPASYFSCEDQGLGSVFDGTCCADGQKCALDSNNQAACCPTNAVCTGTVGTPTTTQSYITNQYFAFPAIPTSFPNTAACANAVSACSENYAACTSDLASGTGGYGVTIVVPGDGGTTVAPTHTTVGLASATSICSSLSSAACHGLQSTRCSVTGSSAGFFVGTENAAMPRITAGPCMIGRVMAGVGLGVWGAL